MTELLKKILLFGNTDPHTFSEIYPDITESNRKNMIIYSMIAAAGMCCMFIASLKPGFLDANRNVYAGAMLISLAIGLFAHWCKKRSAQLVYICVYTFAAMLYAFGIAMGTIIRPGDISVSFPVLLFAVPLFFTDIPIRMNIATALSIFCYCILAVRTQTTKVLVENLASILPYGIISIILSSYMMVIKIRRYALEYENKFLIERDQLTGMLNRRCYEQHLQLFRTGGAHNGLMICAFDINGLKMVNDNLGHAAGDELICGAADCIEGIFGKYGRCYRVGGDEFVAIIDGTSQAEDELKTRLERRCSCFKGNYVSGLSISTGMVSSDGTEQIDELIKRADERMYDDKKLFYEITGNDRRKY